MDNTFVKSLKGNDRTMFIYENKIKLVKNKSAFSFMSSSLIDGEKEIYYSDIIAVKFKSASKISLGFIQFELPGSVNFDNYSSENSWTFKCSINKEAKDVLDYIKTKIDSCKDLNNSVFSDIMNLKFEFLSGNISKDEFHSEIDKLLNV